MTMTMTIMPDPTLIDREIDGFHDFSNSPFSVVIAPILIIFDFPERSGSGFLRFLLTIVFQ